MSIYSIRRKYQKMLTKSSNRQISEHDENEQELDGIFALPHDHPLRTSIRGEMLTPSVDEIMSGKRVRMVTPHTRVAADNSATRAEAASKKFLGIRRKYQKMLMRTKANYDPLTRDRILYDDDGMEPVDLEQEYPPEFYQLDQLLDGIEDQNNFSPKVKTHKGKTQAVIHDSIPDSIRASAGPDRPHVNEENIHDYMDGHGYSLFQNRYGQDFNDDDLLDNFDALYSRHEE